MRNVWCFFSKCGAFFTFLLIITGCNFGFSPTEDTSASRGVASQSAGGSVADKQRATKLTISGPSTVSNRNCSGEFRVWSRNQTGGDAGVASDQAVSLTASRAGLFFLDSQCRQTSTSIVIRKQTSYQSFYFRPHDVGTLTFTAQLNRNSDNLAAGSLVLTSANDLPLISILHLTTAEEQPVSAKIVASDPNGDPLDFQVSLSPAHGTVDVVRTTGEFVYTPLKDYFGPDTFAVVVSDGYGISAPAPVSITVTNVEDPPKLDANASLIVNGIEDQETEVNYNQLLGLSRADDADGDTIRFVVDSAISGNLKINGTAWSASNRTILPGQRLSWKPALNQNGLITATKIRASDGKSLSADSLPLQFQVAPVNDAPTISAPSDFSGGEDADLNLSFADLKEAVAAADVDGDNLSLVVEQILDGSVKIDSVNWSAANSSLSAGQTLTWRPSLNRNGRIAAFRISASDGTLASAAQTVYVQVVAVNDAPVSVDQAITIPNSEGLVYSGTLSATDPDGDSLTFRFLSPPAYVEILNAQSGSFRYTVPTPPQVGTENLVYEVSDGSLTTTATLRISKTEVLPPDLSLQSSGLRRVAGWAKAEAVAYDSSRARYFLAGRQGNGVYLLALRFDGVVDTSFGNSGALAINVGEQAEVRNVLVQGSSVYVAGITRNSGNSDFFIGKWDVLGLPDSNFGNAGFFTGDINLLSGYLTNSHDDLTAVLSNGTNLYLAGKTNAEGTDRPVLLALNATTGLIVGQPMILNFANSGGFTAGVIDGSRLGLVGNLGDQTLIVSYRMDTSAFEFTQVLDFGNHESMNSLTVQSTGKWLLAGRVGEQSIIARLNYNGSLDSSFGAGGTVVVKAAGVDTLAAKCIGYDSQRIWLIADATSQGQTRPWMMTLNSNGQSPLNGFTEAPIRRIWLGTTVDLGACVIHQDGRASLAGALDGQLTLMRYLR